MEIPGAGPFEIMICPLGVSGVNAFSVSATLRWHKPEARRVGFVIGKLDTRAEAGLKRYLGELAAREAKLSARDKLPMPD